MIQEKELLCRKRETKSNKARGEESEVRDNGEIGINEKLKEIRKKKNIKKMEIILQEKNIKRGKVNCKRTKEQESEV